MPSTEDFMTNYVQVKLYYLQCTKHSAGE